MSFEDYYLTTEKNIWQGRIDADPELEMRWHQAVKRLDLNDHAFAIKEKISTKNLKSKNFAFLGFACDEGIKRNQGRTGAKEGPRYLRMAMSNLPKHSDELNLFDAGDVACNHENLESAQQALAEGVAKLLSKEYFPIIMGGGHETAYGHYCGISRVLPGQKIGIINFDAHLDLREPLQGNKGTSGSSFLQIARKCQDADIDFDYLCLGISKAANTPKLFTTAKEHNVKYCTSSEVNLSASSNEESKKINKILDDFFERNQFIYLTICLDGFASPFAPGVSAPTINGIIPYAFMPLFKKIIKSQKLISTDIVELSPRFDVDNRTARLAANLIFELIDNLS